MSCIAKYTLHYLQASPELEGVPNEDDLMWLCEPAAARVTGAEVQAFTAGIEADKTAGLAALVKKLEEARVEAKALTADEDAAKEAVVKARQDKKDEVNDSSYT